MSKKYEADTLGHGEESDVLEFSLHVYKTYCRLLTTS